MLFVGCRRLEGNVPLGDPMAVPRHYLAKLAERMVADQRPMQFETVIERIRNTLQFGRVGSNTRKRLEHARDLAIKDGAVVADTSGFLSAANFAGPLTPRLEGGRRINRIADAELGGSNVGSNQSPDDRPLL